MKYSGKFGISTGQEETSPGVRDDVIVERDYIGDVIQETENVVVEGEVLPTMRTTTSFSVISDGVLKEHYRDLRYVTYAGERWSIASVVLQPPRLVVYIGEVYNGPTPEPTP
jgi:hypothetical protein